MIRERLEKLETYILSVIEDRRTGFGAHVLRVILLLLSRVFAVIVQVRLWLYKKGFFRHHTLGCQVVSVGNLTVGGTGKTPVVEVFARALQKSGRQVAILSRGYKKDELPILKRLLFKLTFQEGRQLPRVVSDGRSLLLDAAQGGDEPFMLASNLPDVAVVVDRDRVKAGRYAIAKLGCDTLILDDGFQYMALKHQLDIVLVDRLNPFGNRRLLPRGILREPIRNIRRAGFIFITKSDGDGTETLKKELRALNPHAEISECRHQPLYLQDIYTRERMPLERLRGLPIAAVSGIAVPKSFEDALIQLGARVLYHKRYADHHRYTQQEIITLINKSRDRGAELIVTTEKDAVRFPQIVRRDLPILFLRVQIEMLTGAEDFYASIERICFK